MAVSLNGWAQENSTTSETTTETPIILDESQVVDEPTVITNKSDYIPW